MRTEAPREADPNWQEKTRRRLAAGKAEKLEREPTAQQRALGDSIGKLIEDEPLPGVSLPVRENFSDAMSAWSQAQDPPAGDVPSIERFALMATALTRPDDIRQALAAEPSRTP